MNLAPALEQLSRNLSVSSLSTQISSERAQSDQEISVYKPSASGVTADALQLINSPAFTARQGGGTLQTCLSQPDAGARSETAITYIDRFEQQFQAQRQRSCELAVFAFNLSETTWPRLSGLVSSDAVAHLWFACRMSFASTCQADFLEELHGRIAFSTYGSAAMLPSTCTSWTFKVQHPHASNISPHAGFLSVLGHAAVSFQPLSARPNPTAQGHSSA